MEWNLRIQLEWTVSVDCRVITSIIHSIVCYSFRKGLNKPDWPTDGRRVQYLSKYVLRCKKGTL